MVAVQVTTAAGGQPAQVAINGDGAGALSGHTVGAVLPGTVGWVYETVPGNVNQVNVTLSAGLGGGAVRRVRVGYLGRCNR
jgi:hypothetical protein